jgi:succinate dehydrogenase/fumarate reductase cytochrome b subunit
MTAAPTRAERAFRACGVAPLAVFVLLHLAVYGQVLAGRRSFGDPDVFRLSAWVIGVELALVAAPLAYHLLYGLYFLARRPARDAGGTQRTLDRVQRWSSLLVLAFVVDHFARFRWPILSGAAAPGDARALLVRELSSTTSGLPLVAAFHLFGVAAVAFHLGYGAYRFDWPTARLAGERRRTLLGVVVGLFVLFTASFAFIELATGKKLVPMLG